MSNGSGIVICAGGWRLPMAWATVALLRLYGTKLPVEIWHLHDEITEAAASLFEHLEATPRRLHATTEGYFTKPHAVNETDFDQVLLIDGDVVPLSRLDDVFHEPQFQQHGAILTPDLGDIRANSWFPEPWVRVGLHGPVCLDGRSHCTAAFETDCAVLAFDRRRCPQFGPLLANLADEALSINRWGGDKELYRVAWEAAGCSVAWRAYPAVVGRNVEGRAWLGHGLLHRTLDGHVLGLHWAWGKTVLDAGPVNISHVAEAPLDGYADHRVQSVEFRRAQVARLLHNTGHIQGFTYSVLLQRCYKGNSDVERCRLRGINLNGLEAWMTLLYFARWALLGCRFREPHLRCTLRRQLPLGTFERARAELDHAKALLGRP